MPSKSYQKCETLYPEMAVNETVYTGQKRDVYTLNPCVQIQPPLDARFFVCK